MMVSLNSQMSVNPEHVVCVHIAEHSEGIEVKMRDGAHYVLRPEHNESKYKLYDRIVEKLNK